MKHALIGLTLSLALASAASPALAVDAAKLAAAQQQLARAAYAHGPEDLIKIRSTFESMSKQEPKSAALHYWVAVADWRLAPRLDDPKQGERFCKDGLDHADRAMKLDPRFADMLAIKAGLLGLSLRYDPGAMMTVGLEIQSHMKRALELAPDNPRVRLLEAMNTLHKPDFVGGGADKALPQFLKAETLFAAEKPASLTAPSWGHAESLIWAGKSAFALADYPAARGYYDRALAIDPGNGWVLHALIPELEKATQEAASKDAR